MTTNSIRLLAAVAAIVTSGPLLAGCAGPAIDEPDDSFPSRTHSPSPTAFFTPRDDALEEAMSVFLAYSEVNMQVSSDYSVDASLLSPYATDEDVDALRAFQDRLRTEGRRMTGESIYRNEQLQEYNPDSGLLKLLVCEDLTNIRMVDTNGVDVTPAERVNEASIQVSFEISAGRLLVEESVLWDGASVC